MLKTILVYRPPQGRDVPIIETSDAGVAQAVLAQSEREFAEAAASCGDPVVAARIRSELTQARAVLALAGLGREEAQQ